MLSRLAAFDIETTTEVEHAPEGAVPGLDPRYGAITDVAVAAETDRGIVGTLITVGTSPVRTVHFGGRTYHQVPAGGHVESFEADGFAAARAFVVPTEKALLTTFAMVLDAQPSDTVLAGWNSSVFDGPFLADRSAVNDAALRLRLHADPGVYVKYAPLPGHAGGYRLAWDASAGHTLDHLDIQAPVKAWADGAGVKHSLKPVATAAGYTPIEVDRQRMHELSDDERWAYVLSDVLVTLKLARHFEAQLDLAAHLDSNAGVTV